MSCQCAGEGAVLRSNPLTLWAAAAAWLRHGGVQAAPAPRFWLAHRGQGSGTRLLIEENGLLNAEGLSSLVVTRLKVLVVCRIGSEKTRRFLLAAIQRLYGFSIFGRVHGKTRKGVLHHTVTAKP